MVTPTLPGNLQKGFLKAAHMTGFQISEDEIMSPSTPSGFGYSFYDIAFTSISILMGPLRES